MKTTPNLDTLLEAESRLHKELEELRIAIKVLRRYAAQQDEDAAAEDQTSLPEEGQGTTSDRGRLYPALVTVLEAKGAASTRELAEAVLAAGYDTKSTNFFAVVNNTLRRWESEFQKADGKWSLISRHPSHPAADGEPSEVPMVRRTAFSRPSSGDIDLA